MSRGSWLGDTLLRRSGRIWAPLLGAALGLAATAGFSDVVSRITLSARVARFHDVVERAIATLDGRLATHQATVSAAAAMLGASTRIDAADFERLVTSTRQRPPPPNLVAWCEPKPTDEGGGIAACPALRLWSQAPMPPLGPTADLTSLGDLRQAMDRAKSGDAPAAAALLPGSTADSQTVAFVFPVLGPADFADRKNEVVRGFVVTAFDARDLLRDALRDSAASVDVVIRDAESGSDAPPLLRTGDSSRPALFTYRHSMFIAGRHWFLSFSSTPRFDEQGQHTLVRLVWTAGFLVTALFTALIWFESRARARAERIGRRLTEVDEGLRRASRAKDEFLAMLGHELRNPLGAITNALRVMRMRNPTDPGALRALSIAERQAAHQSRLVDDLLDLTRLGAGKLVLEPIRVDLRDVARRAAASVRSALDERRHALALVLPSEPVEVLADPTRIEQVVVNLLTNAVKYTPEGGTIELVVREHVPRGEAVISVRDNGIGMDGAELERVFAPFFQAKQNGSEARAGLGIGLTIVKKLVELHGGTVDATSAGRGQGSELAVRLPLSERSPLALVPCVASPLPPTPSSEEQTESLDVLIVEDMNDNREMLAELVSMFGHKVREAMTGGQALVAVGDRIPDLALVDLGLPDMDGLEVARRIRELPDGARVHLVAVTGFGSPEDRERALAAGFDRHLVKPLRVQHLAAVMAEVRPSPESAAARPS